jgi:cell division protein FtsZ
MATETVHEAAGSGANIIFGAVIDEMMSDNVYVTVIATGFGKRQVPDAHGEEIDLFGFDFGDRKGKARKIRPKRPILDKVISPNYIEEDLKIPTFIRNSGELNN